MNAEVKKQHYVTKAYLDGFLEPGEEHLFCWRRHKNAGFRKIPAEVAFHKNYYSFKRTDGTWNDSAETFFANKVENPGLEILKKLVAGDTRLKWEERNALAVLLSIQEQEFPSLEPNSTAFIGTYDQTRFRLRWTFESNRANGIRHDAGYGRNDGW